MNAHLIPLSMASVGSVISIAALAPNVETQKRLASMGIVVGREARVLQQEGKNLVLALGNSRLAMARALAQKVMVKPLPPEAASEGFNRSGCSSHPVE